MNQITKADISIRNIEFDDILAVSDILHDSRLCNHKDLQDRLKYLLNCKNNICLLATLEEKPVGVLLATYNGFHVFLSHIAIANDFKRQGVGLKLHKQLEEEAKAKNAKGIIADSWLSATPFFNKLKYKTPGAVFMIKEI